MSDGIPQRIAREISDKLRKVSPSRYTLRWILRGSIFPLGLMWLWLTTFLCIKYIERTRRVPVPWGVADNGCAHGLIAPEVLGDGNVDAYGRYLRPITAR